MKLTFTPRHLIRMFTDLAAITAVCVIFAVGATKAGIGVNAADVQQARVATAPK